ncbi:ATP-binding protein [Bacteroides hominis]|uniref:ATP-binding protein n=1 Tax=Bacteroides hominis TaxID=2763023 RepID=UPI003D6B598F
MRYLNKIVFINSARIQYAEIQIDGNVHFIGTQGVGKSTALRALLFFYNADKTKLGISKEKKSFDEYYFPYLNSYIIYEVTVDDASYCVLAFRSQGRVCFRFLGTGYKKEYFISPEGKAYEEWDQIRDALGSFVYKSRRVETYEEYRDIIFGNNRGLPPELRKFAITESRQYQNIPRTIQNVFLNSKLDAEFIKQTIIMSLNEEDVRIDLGQYAHHLRRFDEEVTDISKWFRKNKNGEVTVRRQADRVIELYREMHYLEQQARTLAGELNYTFRMAQELLPSLQQKKEELLKELAKEKHQLEELSGKFQSERDRLLGLVRVQNENLKTARERKERYESQDIYNVCDRVNAEPEAILHKQMLEEQLTMLTARFDDINSQYKLLKEQASSAFERFRNGKNAELNTLHLRAIERKEAVRKEYDKILKEVREHEVGKLTLLREQTEKKKEGIYQLKMEREKCLHRTFHEEELQACRTERVALEKENHECRLKLKEAEQQMGLVRRQWELDQTACEQQSGVRQKEIEQQIAVGREKVAEIDRLLDNCQGSLYEWLSRNCPGWENTIGKVVDEKLVLFSKELNPQSVPDTGQDSFYGIKLDLSAIRKEVKSVQEYAVEQEAIRKEIHEWQQNLEKSIEEKEKEMAVIRKKHQTVLNTYKEEMAQSAYCMEQNDKRIQVLKADEIMLEQKAGEEKRILLEQLEKQLAEATHSLQESAAELEQFNHLLETRIRQKEKERNQRMQEEDTLIRNKQEEIHQSIASEKKKTDELLETMDKDLLHELSGKGVDTERITALRNEVARTEQELAFIEQHRRLVYDYEKDKREFFDRMDEFRNGKQLAEKELDGEKEKFRLKEEELNQKVTGLNKQLAETNTRLKHLEEDIRETENFKILNICPPVLQTGVEAESVKRCKKVIEELTQNHYRQIEQEKDFREAVGRFTGNFSEQNTFNFRTRLTKRDEFMTFAADLKEFIDNDKIIDFERRSNEAYTDLIHRIGKETADMLSKEGLIRKTINDINSDFVERNFAGVIKSIALQIVPSGNRIMQHFVTIKEFCDRNQPGALGMFSLFGQEELVEQNRQAVSLLQSLVKELALNKEKELTLSDTFELQFRIVENDNDSGWVEKLANVGSDGTDILVKAMINIMLLNVFKEKASHQFNDFKLHCMMDEIGKLHPNNIKGILDFANNRNIILVNSSPTSYRASDYKYTYILNKDKRNITSVTRLIKQEVRE